MSEHDVVVEVLTVDFDLVNRWDPPQFACSGFGINEVEGRQHLTATVTLSAPDEATALRAADEQLRAYLTEHEVVASRVRLAVGRRPDPRLKLTPWQRAEVESAIVDLVWDSYEPLARVAIAETPTTVTITLYEHRDPEIYGYVSGDGIYPRRGRLRLATPLSDRALLDGATGRAPGDLGIWDFDARALLARVLALDIDQLEVITVAEAIISRA